MFQYNLSRFKYPFRSKPRFSYTEVKLLLDEVKKNRHILLKKFNRGVSVDTKKQKWTEITDQINGLGENHREIMKKWADLKCDGKRRLLALRGPNGSNLRKKRLGPVERMVHRILMMSPSRGQQLCSCFHVSFCFPSVLQIFSPSRPGLSLDFDQDWSPVEDFPKLLQTGSLMQPPAPYSYLNLNENSGSHGDGLSFDMSPLSSPENEPGEQIKTIRFKNGGKNSLQQQRAGRLLLGSVSRSLEVLTRSVQLLVESQQEFVQESLQLQRDAVDVLRDFSETSVPLVLIRSVLALYLLAI
uniref:Zgc:113149 n=1 Tax=Poecilia reticulata TaxID=8081 RepID=A0A3P9NJ43_POERE